MPFFMQVEVSYFDCFLSELGHICARGDYTGRLYGSRDTLLQFQGLDIQYQQSNQFLHRFWYEELCMMLYATCVNVQ